MKRKGKEASTPRPARSPRTVRRAIILSGYMIAGSLVLARAAHLQVVEHDRWVAEAEDQHRERVAMPARRGAIFDRKGVPLALSHETYRVSVAPNELRDPRAATEAIATGLGLSPSRVRAAVNSSRRWVVLPGRYTADQRAAVGSVRGVHFEREFERFYPQGDAGRELVGLFTVDGQALGGIEQQFDDVLQGEPGYTVLRRDASGEARPAFSLPVVPPQDGSSVYLTIDFDLQAIADGALRDAIEKTGSSGGDLMIADPHTGELLAAVSRRADRSRSLNAITEPYEPGSTLKPFIAATLLAEGEATLADSVYAESGEWRDGNRTFRDTSPHEWLSLGKALEVSSNIAFAKFSDRLSPGQQYAYLRGFGFGTATGIEYPSESSGRLRRPAEWSRLSAASLAIGYELSVTPLQVLAAYGALANGGVLMEPFLVREVRASDGELMFRRSPHALRQVIPASVASAVGDVLVHVVDEGTATRASLESFALAGKTGTSWRTGPSGAYEPGAYTSTFAGYFPAADPQIVIFVKLDEPQGEYYGGLTAAPVTRETLQAMLAARSPGIDVESLLATRANGGLSALPSHSIGDAPRVPTAGSEGRYVFFVDEGLPAVAPSSEEKGGVPRVDGLPLREAVRRIHAAGFQVHLEGSGPVKASRPAAGEQIRRGEVVTLVGEAGL